MNDAYAQHFQVRLHDLDAWQRIRSSRLLQYMEQVAVDMSTAAGFAADWYVAQGTAWVMRGIQLQRVGPAEYGDELITTAWVSSSQRIRLWCEYEVRHVAGAPVAVGKAEWIYIDRARRMPRPIDPAILSAWPTQAASPLWKEPAVLSPAASYDPHVITHTVYSYDADVMGHTNNTVYADWLEEAAGAALRAWDYPLDLPQPAAPKLRLDLQNLEIQYLGPTRPGDQVTLVSTYTGSDTSDISLTQEICGPTGDTLVRSKTMYALITNPTPTPAPVGA